MLRNAFAGKIVGGFMGFVFGLPFGYLFGLPIVLVMWVEDWFLSDKIGLGMKVATSACVGYVASIAMLLLTSALHLQLPQILSFVLLAQFQRLCVRGSLGQLKIAGPRASSSQ
jgi:uncharacterized protein YqgC (DUF456 family)